jgi:hypothetical protein
MNMKYIATLLLVFFGTFYGNSQINSALKDSTDLPPHSVRVIATVKSADFDYMVIVIEYVVAYSRGISATPMQGDELTVRLPGRNKPEIESRIEVDLKESIDVGAMPSSYIMLDYRSIE